MTILDKMINPGNALYYDPGFRVILEDHIPIMMSDPSVHVIAVDAMQAYIYENDLFALLQYYDVPTELHWITMRMNRMRHPREATRNLTLVFVPRFDFTERLVQVYKTLRQVH